MYEFKKLFFKWIYFKKNDSLFYKMYLVIHETRHHGWVANLVSKLEAERGVSDETNTGIYFKFNGNTEELIFDAENILEYPPWDINQYEKPNALPSHYWRIAVAQLKKGNVEKLRRL